MRKNLTLVATVLLLVTAANAAIAAPSCNGFISGSTYVVACTNNEDKNYSCVANFDLSDNTAPPRHFNNPFGVKAKYNGNVLITSTGWAASTLSAGPLSYGCN